MVASVNGVPIRNLRHLVEVLRDARDEYVIFRFAEDGAETLVFRRKELEAATAEVMSENGIPRRGTPEVLAVWSGKGAKPDRVRPGSSPRAGGGRPRPGPPAGSRLHESERAISPED